MSVESFNDLSSRLADQDYLSPERPHLLTELLLTIQRTRLVRDLNLTHQESPATGLISPYRWTFYIWLFLSESSDLLKSEGS